MFPSSPSLSFFATMPPPSLPRANTDNQNQNQNINTPLLLPTPSATPIKATNVMFPIHHHHHLPTLTRANSSTTPANPNPMALSPLRHPLQPPPPSGPSYSPLRVGTPSSTATRQSGTPAPIARPPAARRADTMALVSPAVDSTLHLAGQSLATGLDVAARRADIVHHLQELAEHQHHAYHHLGGAVVHHQLQQQMQPSAAYFQQQQQQQSQQQTNPFGSSTSPTRYQQHHRPTAPAPAPAPVPGISSATAARLLPPTMERHISVPSVLPSWLQPTSKPSPPTQPSSTVAAAAVVHQPSPRTQGFVAEPNSATMGDDLGRDRDPWRAENDAWEQHQHAQQQQQPQRAMPATAVMSSQWPAAGADVHMDVMSQAGESFNLFQEHAAAHHPSVVGPPSAYYVPQRQQLTPSGFNQQHRPHPRAATRPTPMSHPTHASPTQPQPRTTFHSPQSPFTHAFASPALAGYADVPHNTPVAPTSNTFLVMGSPLGSPPASAFLASASVPPNTPAGAADDELADMQVSVATPHYRFETTDSFDPTAPLFLTTAPPPAPAGGQGGAFVGDFGLAGVQGQHSQQQAQVYVPLDLFGGSGGGGGSPAATVFFGQGQQVQQQGHFVQQQQAQGGYQGTAHAGFNANKLSPSYANLDEPPLEQHQLNLVPGLNFTMGGGQHHHHQHHHGPSHFHAHPNAPPLTPDPGAFALDKKLQPLVWSPTPNPVIRINNISWDMTIFDIQHYLHPLSIAHLGGLPLIHILMVRETGKTRSDAYVELDTMNDAMVALRERQRRILRGRVVTLHRASQAELLRLLFPNFVGEFHLVDAVPAGEREAEEGVATSYVAMQRMVHEQRAREDAGAGASAGASAGANAAWLDAFARLALPGVRGGDESMASSFSSGGGGRASTATSTQTSPTVGQATSARRLDFESAHGVGMLTQPPTPAPQSVGGDAAGDQAHGQLRDYVFLTRTEINQILSVCKNYKLFFSRKCSQRPFENVIVILLKFPWHQRHLLSTLQRDHLFELTKLAIESLRSHLHKPTHAMDPTLMDRMVRAALLVPAFTDRQKAIVLEVAGKVGMAKSVGLEEACREIGAGRNDDMMGQMQAQAPLPLPLPPPTPDQAGAGNMPPLPSALAHQLGVPMWSPHAHTQDQHPPLRAYMTDKGDIDFGGGRGPIHDTDAMDVSDSGFGYGGAGRMFGNGGGNEQAMGSTPPRAAAGYHESQATHASAGGMSPTAPMFVPRYSATMASVAGHVGGGETGGGFQMRDEAAGPARSAEGSGMQY